MKRNKRKWKCCKVKWGSFVSSSRVARMGKKTVMWNYSLCSQKWRKLQFTSSKMTRKLKLSSWQLIQKPTRNLCALRQYGDYCVSSNQTQGHKVKNSVSTFRFGYSWWSCESDLFKEGILSNWLNTASHNKNTGKCCVGSNDSFQGCESIKIVGCRLPSFTIKCKFELELNFLPLRKDGKFHPCKIIIRLNTQMRLVINFLNSQRMFEWDGIKVPFVKKGFWNEQTNKAFIQNEQSFVEQCYEAPLPE